MSIISAYDSLFYCFYKWSSKLNGKEYPNVYSASLMLTLILFINLTTLYSVINKFTGLNVLSFPEAKIFIILTMAAVGMGNHKYFTYRNRNLDIVERFEAREISNQRTNIVVGSVTLGSLLVLFLVWSIGIG